MGGCGFCVGGVADRCGSGSVDAGSDGFWSKGM